MGKALAFLFGVVCYLIFFVTSLYAIGFLANFAVPKSIDTVAGAPAALGTAVIVNIVLLGIFAVQHSGMARPGFKQWWMRMVPEPIERATYVLLSSLVMILLFWQWQAMPGMVWKVDHAFWTPLLWVVYGLGWAILLLATVMINHFHLFGLQQVFVHLRGKPQPEAEFKEPGFYKLVRHPIMVGWIIIFWATPEMSIGHLLFAIVTTVYILIALQLEERDLIAVLGDAYTSYRDRVPGLIPFWPKGKGGSSAGSRKRPKTTG